MCGITGIFSYAGAIRADEATIATMRDTMNHRGPDGGGSWISDDGKVGLGHRRLSIIDLSTTADQPMTNAEGTVRVVFNGEIYNHMTLRRELEAAGCRFKTDHSDTEVLVHGYSVWGIDGLLERIWGDYGVALWDDIAKKLFLFRDRCGVKPLYFSFKDGSVMFGSEIKAILANPRVERDVEPVAMYHYLSFLTTPAPFTMFKGVYKLPAGTCMEIDSAGKVRSWRYWDATPGKAIDKARLSRMEWPEREKFYVGEIRERLGGAVERRMMSDVPFGVFLSGGIDSSTNVALMTQHMDRPVDTYTVGFKDHEHLNELGEARLVADRFKTNHHEVLIDERDMRDYLGDLVHHQDEPIADWVCIPLYFVSKLAKDSGATVVQVGEGSDEQFCGYSGYMAYLEMYRKYWSPFRKYVPGPFQHLAAGAANFAARIRPGLGAYADVIDRAARDREHFWSGAYVFPETVKRHLLEKDNFPTPDVPREMIESGLLPPEYCTTDTFEIIRSFNRELDKAAPGHDILARMTYNEFRLRLPELLLMRVDKIGMSVSLEARVPFLDHNLVEFSMDIPMEDKVHNGVAKYLLKKAVEGLIPDEIIYRKKMGFGAPMAQWMRGQFGQFVEAEIMNSRLMKRGYFDREMIGRYFREHRDEKNDFSLYLWTLFNLTAWYDYWIDGAR